MKDAEKCTKFEKRASTRFNANQVFVGSRLISTVAAAAIALLPSRSQSSSRSFALSRLKKPTNIERQL